MEYIIQFQINIFALSILVLLYIVVNVRITVETFSRKLLLILILVSGAAIITEPLTWIFDSQQFFGAYFLEYLTNMMLIMFGPIIAGLMLSYVRYYTEKDISVVYKHWYYMHPAILTAVMLVINIFYPIYFSIDKTCVIFESTHYPMNLVKYESSSFLVTKKIFYLCVKKKKWKIIEKNKIKLKSSEVSFS